MGELLKLLASAAAIEARKAIKAWLEDRKAGDQGVSVPLSYRDVAHQQRQIASATAKVVHKSDRSEP